MATRQHVDVDLIQYMTAFRTYERIHLVIRRFLVPTKLVPLCIEQFPVFEQEQQDDI
jgi:hypothetical protein